MIKCRAFGDREIISDARHGLTAVAIQCRAFGAQVEVANPPP